MRRSGAINCPMSNACICHYSPSVRVIQLPVETPFHIISPNVITHAIARPVHGITLVRIDPSIGLLHIITQRPSPFLSPQTIGPKDNSVFVSETLPSLGITRQLFDAGSWTNHTSAYRGGRLSMANPFRTLQPSIETACTRFPHPIKRTANQCQGGRRVLRKRKALSRLRACSLLGEPLSDRIGHRWRLNVIGTRALARYGRSAHEGVYPSHLAASFSTVPSSWSFLMASLMALVSSGLSLFTATAYSSPVATSRTTWASL